jgi:hypothetical protein
MTHEIARTVFAGIDASAQTEHKIALYQLAIRYAEIRATWLVSPPEERRHMERARTATHNALIDAFNILQRNMARRGEDVSWAEHLVEDRRELGDLACHISCLLGLAAR